MSATAGKTAALYSNGVDLSAYFRSGSVAGSASVEDSTTWGPSVASRAYTPTLLDSTASFGGFFDGSADAVDEELHAALGAATDPILAWLPSGDVLAARGYEIVADLTGYEVDDEVDGLVEVAAEVQGNGWYPVVVLAPKASRSSTLTGTAVDNGAATTNGGTGFLHVFSVSAGDTIDGVIQDSADGSTDWQTICTFAQVTDAGDPQAQKVVIAAGSTIRRYTRAVLTLAGASIAIVAACQLHRSP